MQLRLQLRARWALHRALLFTIAAAAAAAAANAEVGDRAVPRLRN